jgi:hypothetical protein
MSGTVLVVIRTGRDPRGVDRALASVRAQSHTDWSLVLAVPEGDDVPEAGAGVPVVRATGRGGLANAALAAADGDLVVLHDDDSTWSPDFLARTTAFLADHPDHVAVAARAELVHHDELRREVLAADEPLVSLTSLLRHNYVPPASLLFRRSAAEAVGRFDEELPALEDWEFLLRLVAHGPVGLLPGSPLAAWYAGPPTETAVQRAAELRVRDHVLRRDLTGKEPGPGGLGLLLALSDHVSGAADQWGRDHRGHLDAVTTEQRLELGRVRGEVLLMRELLSALQDDVAALGAQVEEALRPDARPAGRSRRTAPEPPPSLARRAVRRLSRGR